MRVTNTREQHQQHRDADDEAGEVDLGDRAASPGDDAADSSSGAGKAIWTGLPAEPRDEQHAVLEDLADRERGQQQRDLGSAAQRPVGDRAPWPGRSTMVPTRASRPATGSGRPASKPANTAGRPPTIITSPWAKLMSRRMPKMIARPTAISAYRLPARQRVDDLLEEVVDPRSRNPRYASSTRGSWRSVVRGALERDAAGLHDVGTVRRRRARGGRSAPRAGSSGPGVLSSLDHLEDAAPPSAAPGPATARRG